MGNGIGCGFRARDFVAPRNDNKRRGWRCCLALVVLAALTLVALTLGAHAQDYPSRPVKVIISITAGAGPDVITRIVGEHLGKLWGQQVVVENRPGAGGAIAVRAAGASAPDGYTLYVAVASNFLALPEMLAKLPHDVARDFVPIGFVGAHPMVIGASAELGVDTLPALIALAKQRPGAFNIGISTRGSLPHLTAEWLRMAGGVDMTIVHYPGAPQALADLMGGRIHVVIESLATFAPAIAAGKLKPLAVATAQRLKTAPDLPAVAETLPGFLAMGWFALMAPPGTPEPIARKVSADLRTVLAQPEAVRRLTEIGTYLEPMSPDELVSFIRKQQQAWKPVLTEIEAKTPK
jgi:tripartite-type tricarboxylate transporter receptor subunit TctC